MNYYFTNTYNLFTTFTQTSDKPKNVREPPSGTDLAMNKVQVKSPKQMLFIEFPSGFQIKHTHTHTHTHTQRQRSDLNINLCGLNTGLQEEIQTLIQGPNAIFHCNVSIKPKIHQQQHESTVGLSIFR